MVHDFRDLPLVHSLTFLCSPALPLPSSLFAGNRVIKYNIFPLCSFDSDRN